MAQDNHTVTVFVPWPPSLNRLWRSGKGRVYRDAKYIRWLNDAGWAIKQAKCGKIKGKFTAEIVLTPPNKRRIDMDNRMKAIFDLAQKLELIEDDSLCDLLIVSYDYKATKPGALLTIEAVKD
jgi:crossover junction endodeoxyribonuclease RusA